MLAVRAIVICNCREDNDEMEEDEQFFEHKDSRIQSRIYTCPNCKHSIVVVIDFRGN